MPFLDPPLKVQNEVYEILHFRRHFRISPDMSDVIGLHCIVEKWYVVNLFYRNSQITKLKKREKKNWKYLPPCQVSNSLESFSSITVRFVLKFLKIEGITWFFQVLVYHVPVYGVLYVEHWLNLDDCCPQKLTCIRLNNIGEWMVFTNLIKNPNTTT